MLPWLTPTLQDDARQERVAQLREVSLSQLVRDDVLDRILNGTLVPGQRINEPDVAKRLQVSRVPVREALRELVSSGLVVARKHSGVFVRELDATEVRELYALRALLDGYAGRCVAQLTSRPRARLVTLLDEPIEAMNEAAHALDVQRYYRENLRFHWTIVDGAGNTELANSYRGVVQKLHLARLKNLSHDSGMRRSIAEHQAITQALRDGDHALSERLMVAHVDDAFDRLAPAQATRKPRAAPPSKKETHP